MHERSIKKLVEKLPVYQKPGAGGQSFPFYKTEDVVNRFNEAFGHDWSNHIQEHFISGDEVIVLVTVTVKGISHSQFGHAPIKKSKHDKDKPVSIGNDYMSAASKGFKKCAELFGVGSTLSGSYFNEEPEESGFAPQEAATAPSNNPVMSPVSSSTTISTKAAPDLSVSEVNLLKKLMDTFEPKVTAPTPSPQAPSKPSSFPVSDTAVTAKASDMQVHAMSGLSKQAQIEETDVLKETNLFSEEKGITSYGDLSHTDAITVILFLQSKHSSGENF